MPLLPPILTFSNLQVLLPLLLNPLPFPLLLLPPLFLRGITKKRKASLNFTLWIICRILLSPNPLLLLSLPFPPPTKLIPQRPLHNLLSPSLILLNQKNNPLTFYFMKWKSKKKMVNTSRSLPPFLSFPFPLSFLPHSPLSLFLPFLRKVVFEKNLTIIVVGCRLTILGK